MQCFTYRPLQLQREESACTEPTTRPQHRGFGFHLRFFVLEVYSLESLLALHLGQMMEPVLVLTWFGKKEE